MSRKCIVCNKKAGVGNNVSHANNKSKRRWQPNLQKIRIIFEGKKVRALVCTKCLKKGKVLKAI